MRRVKVLVLVGMVLVGCQAAAPNQVPPPKELSSSEWSLLFEPDLKRSTEPTAPMVEVQPKEVAPDVVISLPSAWPPAPAEVECVFPVQSVELKRRISFTDTPPSIPTVNTDSCGNVITYTESKAVTPTWQPTEPSVFTRSPDASSFRTGEFKAPGKEYYGTIAFDPQTSDYTIILRAIKGDRLHQILLHANSQRLNPLVAKQIVESFAIR